jgi:hypothetical protein
MNKNMTVAIMLSIVLAVGAPLISALSMAKKFQDYPSILVEIEPYDPRDLLYGQYLHFQIKWNWEKPASPESQMYEQKSACLCIGEGSVNPPVSLMECSASKAVSSCTYSLKGKSWGENHFENGIHRYYVGEDIAKPLENLFVKEKRKFSLDLHITPDGETLPGELYIEDEPLKEFLARNGNTVPGVIVEETP